MRRSLAAALVAVLLALGAAAQQRPKSGFFTTSDGVRLHYLEAGRGQAIVFVPGWTMPAWIWEAQIRHFSAHYHVVALDPRSQGESGKPDHGNFPDRRAQDIRELVQELKLGPAVLVGWSLAVPELLTYAEKFGGGDVRGYVLVDGFAWEHRDPEFRAGIVNFYPQVEGRRRDFTEKFVRSMYRKPQSEEYIQRVVRASMSTPADSAVAMSVTSVARTDWRPALGKVDRPVMVVCESQLKSVAADPVRTAVPSARVELFEDAGHALFVDDSERFNSVLDDFLQHLPPSPAR